MGLRINTNVSSLQSINNLKRTTQKQNSAMQKLATGSRINKAADDAAGLAISENLKADIRSSNQAMRNANDSISLIQTAEGGMNEVSGILIRLRELSVQSASDTIGDKERKLSNIEFQNMVNEIDRIAKVTEFNGAALLNGQGGLYDFQIGTGSNKDTSVLQYDTAKTDSTASTLNVQGLEIASKDSAVGSLDKLDSAINGVNANRANLGALQNRLRSTVANLEVKIENISAANSQMRDTDVAIQSAELIKSNVISAAGTSVLSQANSSVQVALKLLG